MAIVLDLSTFEEGLQSETMLLLSSFNWIVNNLPSPYDPAVIKTLLEAGQPSTFTSEAFTQYLQRIYDLPIDNTALSAIEKTIKNNIREYIEPPAYLDCCGGDVPTTVNSVIGFEPRIGSATFEEDYLYKLTTDVDCAVYEIIVTITPSGGAPAPTINPVTLNNLGCIDGGRRFSKLWQDYVADPSGFSYDTSADFKDKDGVTIVILADSYVHP